MKQLQFLIKPAAGYCNMRCQYCFYRDEQQNRVNPEDCMMTRATAETLIQRRNCTARCSGSGRTARLLFSWILPEIIILLSLCGNYCIEVTPPSTLRVTPVINSEPSLQRKRTAAAISLPVPRRP